MINAIITRIKELEIEFQSSQGLILSESDLKCNIFRKIYSLFEHSVITMDNGILASPLHSELKFFDMEDNLKIIPDITILDTNNLSIFHSIKYEITSHGIKYLKPTGKQFEFGGDAYILELKFCKNKHGISRKNYIFYKKDIEKIKRLQEIVNIRSDGGNKIFGLFAVFNKTNKRPDYFDELFDSDSEYLKIVYCSGKVDFNRNDRYIAKFE